MPSFETFDEAFYYPPGSRKTRKGKENNEEFAGTGLYRNILHNEDVCNLAQHFSAKLCQIEKASECLLNGDQSSEKTEACRPWDFI